MAYVDPDYPTKKALKEAIAAGARPAGIVFCTLGMVWRDQ